MSSRRSLGALLALGCILATIPRPAAAAGARSFKSGPIQISADGAWIWVVNSDNDSVSRIEVATDVVTEFPLPPDPPGPGAATRHAPRGLSVSEGGLEVWIACHDSDRVYVMAGIDGILNAAGDILARIDLPWGSGPYGVALSRPDPAGGGQRWALVTCHRAEAIEVYDVQARTLIRRLAPAFRSPLGAAWLDDGVTAWVTHLFADGEDPRMSRIDMSGPEPRLKSEIFAKSTNPKRSLNTAGAGTPNGLDDPVDPARNVAEGGYLTFRGHPAQIPSSLGGARIWCPTQYNNINENSFSPESTIQSTIRQLDVRTRLIPNTNNDKVILTAVHVHDPTTGGNNPPYVGPGWDAHVSGPVDIGFSTDGMTGVVLFEQSNDLVVMPTSTPAVMPPGMPLPEIAVGYRPLGLALSPTSDLAYVSNSLSFDVSVVDLAARTELRRIPVTPATGPLFPLDTPTLLRGAQLFHESGDARISANQKVSCASCHPHGEHDGRTWDLQALPGLHGPRATMSLLGLSLTFGPPDPATGFGQLHRSGDRDEVQDFDHTFAGVNMGGAGFLGGALNTELGASNAGLDPDLDAIAEYVLALPPLMRSPHREALGTLSEAATRGATFFVGVDPAKIADAACAACHVPETGFVDFRFHDVGQRRPPAGTENELGAASRAPFQWQVNTPTLIGCWTTPPYDGVSTFAEGMLDVLVNLSGRTSHGRPGGLTGRQLRDLAEFVLSIDGATTAAEVRAARDTTPPRIVRVEPASLTLVDVWFSESVDPASSADVANWSARETGAGMPVTITGARWHPKNGDRVTLTVDRFERGCAPLTYEIRPIGPILDMADRATGGVANAVDLADAANTKTFAIADTMTITLGTSGYENLDVAVHDCSAIGPGLSNGSHGSIWLNAIGTTPGNPVGWIRFDWAAPFAAATGVASGADIVDAAITLNAEWGDSQVIDARRCLKPWRDGGHGDWSYQNPPGAPSWTNNINGTSAWGMAGCLRRAAGVEGQVVADYNGANDTAFTPDASVAMPATNEPLVIGGPLVASAFGFWFDNPSVDYGYALRLASGSWHEAKFRRSESERGLEAPHLTITYRLPLTMSVPPPEVSGPASPAQLLVAKDPAGLRLSFEDLGLRAVAYGAYAGSIGPTSGNPADWYSHAGFACGTSPLLTGRGRDLVVAEPVGHAYLLITAADDCDEGPTGRDSFGRLQDPSRRDCPP